MLLKDKTLQDQLKQDGYIIVPFLKAEELAALNTFYNNIHNGQEPPGFIDEIHMTTWCQDKEYKQRVSENLKALFTNASERVFKDYRRLNNVFIIKRSGQQTTFKVHQDWNVIDETKYESVNVWVPLHDVDEQSGALWVVKGSHRINRAVRGAGYLFPEYGPYFKELEKNAVSVKLKAGEAIVFYHAVIHGSPPNLSHQLRKAACFSVIPANAPLCIYFQQRAGEPLQVHEPVDEFVYNYTDLRTEASVIPPSEKPVQVLPSFENKKVEQSELKPLFKTKRSGFFFWKK